MGLGRETLKDLNQVLGWDLAASPGAVTQAGQSNFGLWCVGLAHLCLAVFPNGNRCYEAVTNLAGATIHSIAIMRVGDESSKSARNLLVFKSPKPDSSKQWPIAQIRIA